MSWKQRKIKFKPKMKKIEAQYIYNKNKLVLPFTDLICLLQILSLAFTCVGEIRFMCFSPYITSLPCGYK